MSGEFRPLNGTSVAITLIALLEGLVLLWVVDPRAIRWREQAETSLGLILTGILQTDVRGD